MSIANDNLPPFALLQALLQMKPQERKAEEVAFLARYGVAARILNAYAVERDEWSAMVRAGLCWSVSANINSGGAGTLALLELAPGFGSATSVLVKRVVVSSEGGQGTVEIRRNVPAAFQAATPLVQVPCGPTNVRTGAPSVPARQGTIAVAVGGTVLEQRYVGPNTPQVFEVPGAFICELSDSGVDANHLDVFQVSGSLVNAPLVVSVYFAAVPQGGY